MNEVRTQGNEYYSIKKAIIMCKNKFFEKSFKSLFKAWTFLAISKGCSNSDPFSENLLPKRGSNFSSETYQNLEFLKINVCLRFCIFRQFNHYLISDTDHFLNTHLPFFHTLTLKENFDMEKQSCVRIKNILFS